MKLISIFLLMATVLFAGENPASKVYITDSVGNATITNSERIFESKKQSVYTAQGLTFETKKSSNQSFVLSNGVGVYMEEDSHLTISKFTQESFHPSVRDMGVEPSVSKTSAHIPHGYITICTPKIVAGSKMVYVSSHGKVKLNDNKVAIHVTAEDMTIIPVEGDVSVEIDTNNFKSVKVGDKAILSNGVITIKKASDEEIKYAEERISVACRARKTVYFDSISKHDESPSEISEIVVIPIVPKDIPNGFIVSPAELNN